MTNLHKYPNILKLAVEYKLEVVKYMHPLHINKLLQSLHDDYVKINETHKYNTRQIQNKVYFKHRIKKSKG